jgi:glycosyltransferase involved in cell wall biosynthesis
LAAAWNLARILRDWQADLLHTHHYDEALIGWLATRIYRSTKLVVGRHYSTEIELLPAGFKRYCLLAGERLATDSASRVIVPSSQIAERLIRQNGDLAPKVDRVPYGFVAAKYDVPRSIRPALRQSLNLEGRFIIGCFGRLKEGKGQHLLLKAAAQLKPRLPEMMILFVGDGPARARLEKMITDLGLGDVVRLLGWRQDAMEVMSAVDLVVQPTLSEAFSQVMVEALWMNKPLVMTDVSGVRDVIRHGESGLIVPAGDVRALEAAIERLAGDPGLAARIAEEGHAYVSQNLRAETVVTGYERTYLKALKISGTEE